MDNGADALGELLAGIDDRRAGLVRCLAEAVLTGPGALEPRLRQAAARGGAVPPVLAAYVEKVAGHAYKVTDEDIAALRQAGYSEDQIFELTVSVAVGAGLKRVQAALRALQGGTSDAT